MDSNETVREATNNAMHSNATIRETTSNAAKTVREDGAPETVRESASSAPTSIVSQKFRDYDILQQLRSSGSESDIYVVSKGADKYILKLYRYGIEPKIEVINKIVSLSKSSPRELIHIFEFDFDEGTKRWFEIQEYAEKGSLKQLIDNIPKLGEKGQNTIFVATLRQLSACLKLLHENEILHLDLKPANVLVRSLKPIDFVLIDFGISNSLDSELSKKFTAVRGTPMYQSPESWSGAIGKPSDWWSLGMLAFEIANGKHPFEGLSQQVIASLLMTKSIEIPEKIPQDKREILHGLLTRDMSNRWSYDQVSRWLGGERNIPVHFEKPAAENAPPAEKQIHNENIRPLSFLGEKHTSLDTFARAVATDETSWAKGRELLMRGNIRTWLESNGEFELAIDIDLLVEEAEDPDEKLFIFVHFYGKPLPFVFMGKVITFNNLYLFLGRNLRREEQSKTEAIIAEKFCDGKLLLLLDNYLQHNESNNELDELKRIFTRIQDQIFSSIQGKTPQLIFSYLNAKEDIKKGLPPKNFSDLCAIGTIYDIQEAIRLGAYTKNDDDWTALVTAAARNNDPEVITALVKAGADVNAVNAKNNPEGSTALMVAAGSSGNPEIVSALLKAGADINAKNKVGWTALMMAARFNSNPEIISVLLKNGSEKNTKNKEGWTVLMIAARFNGNPEIISVFLKNGADINAKNKEGLPALMMAAQFNSNPEVVTALLKAGADVNAKYELGFTALMAAAQNSNPEIITALFNAGADVNAKDNNGCSALIYAALKNQNPEVVSALLNVGADVNAKNNGVTALMVAAMHNSNPEVINALLNSGADAKTRANNGQRAIDYAAQNPNLTDTEAFRRLQAVS